TAARDVERRAGSGRRLAGRRERIAEEAASLRGDVQEIEVLERDRLHPAEGRFLAGKLAFPGQQVHREPIVPAAEAVAVLKGDFVRREDAIAIDLHILRCDAQVVAAAGSAGWTENRDRTGERSALH